MKRSLRNRLISSVLIIALMITAFPAAAFAAETETSETSSSLQDWEEDMYGTAEFEDEEEASEAVPVAEDESLREENVKHFVNSDGSYTAVNYFTPVHYQEEGSDEWTEIDNTLIEVTEEENGEEVTSYIPQDSPVEVEITESAEGGQTISLQGEEHKISWSYEDAKSTKGQKKNKGKKNSDSDREDFALDKTLTDSLVYEDIAENTDLEVIVDSNNLKENLILKDKNVQTEYIIRYEIGDLFAEQVDEHTIALMDGDETVFTIYAPYMTDAEGNVSEDVKLQIFSQDETSVRVILGIDKKWLKDEERVFPVTVDPYILEETSSSASDATAIYNSGNTYPYGTLAVGSDGENGAYKKAQSYIKFDLPTLKAGDMVTGAYLNVAQYSGEYGYSHAETEKLQINVYRVKDSWTASDVKNSSGYSGVPNRDTDMGVIDYTTVSQVSNAQYISFNVSKLVKAWYDGTENYGLCLRADDVNAWALARFYSTDIEEVYEEATGENVTVRPYLQINYLNNKGLEGRWTYHEQSLGESGTGYVNDYTGNLVFTIPLVETTGNVMPVSLSMVYNGYQKGKSVDQVTTVGEGWRLNIQQCIIPIDSDGTSLEKKLYEAGYRYIYEDADGTAHYFKLKEDSTTVYVDEEGLGLELKKISTEDTMESYQLTADDGGKLTFTSKGYLRRAYNDNGKFYKIFYSSDVSGAIAYIQDGAERKIYITRDSDNRITTIKDPAGREVNLTYSSTTGSLLTVSYPDGTSTSLGYTSGRLRRVRGRDNIRLQYLYPDTGDTATKNRVIGIEEYSNTDGGEYAEANKGNSLEISYPGLNRTVFTDNTGFREVYQFDNYGRTISVNDSNGGAGSYKYDNGSENIKNTNKITATGSTSRHVNNLLKNHSFEEGRTDWTYISSGTAVSTDYHYLGEKSVEVSSTSAYIMQRCESTSGTYTFSAYVKTDSADVKPYLRAAFYDENDKIIQRIDSEPLGRQTSWTRMRVTFTVPEGAAYFSVVCRNEGEGTSWFDCMQLETGRSVNTYNLVENSNFADTSSEAWTTYGTDSSDGYITNTGYGRCYRIYGDSSKIKRIEQTIRINKAARDVHFSVSGLGYGSSVPIKNSRKFGVVIYTYFTDGSSNTSTISFNEDYSGGWQYATGVIGYSGNNAAKTVDYITVRCVYNYNENVARFDNIKVNLDETGTAYTYEKGNLKTAIDNAGRQQNFTYNSAGDLLTANSENADDNISYAYTYDSKVKHRLLSAISNTSNLKFSFGYDSTGNVTSQTVRYIDENGEDSDAYIRRSTVYTDDGNYIYKEYNDVGEPNIYTYNETKGLITTVTDRRGNDTTYTYDSNDDNILSVASSDTAVDYTYNSKNYLTKISTANTDYSFTYDSFGNVVKTKAGSNTLNTNTYNANNGTLASSEYGNGFVTSYTYDSYDRVTSQEYNGTDKFYWSYNADGLLGRHKDLINGKEYYYTYDLVGRLIRTDISDGSYFRTNYNDLNLSTSLHYCFNDTVKNVYYTYSTKDNLPLAVKFGTGSNCQVKNSYDDLTRLSKKTYASLDEDASDVTVKYGYHDWVNQDDYPGRTSGQIDSINYTYTSGGLTLNDRFYEYDDNGNIVSERKGTTSSGSLREKYTYDSLNQLTRNDSAVQNKSYKYSYDDAGNILTKKEYDYTTGTLGTATDTITYEYSDSDWGDLLVSYDGQEITYDEIGNMLTFGDKTFTWQGRSLKKITEGDNTSSYLYNSDGIRTKKTVNGTETEYFLNGDQIIAQKTGDDVIWFIYDSEGNRVGLNRNGLAYYYLYNLQGDVVGIVRASTGKVVATYEYDAWGNCTVSNADGFTVGNANPFRYRGYYWDEESGLYYLNSRYYDPEIGRFISADSAISGIGGDVTGYNLYSYCANNPINFSDENGNWPKWAQKIGKVVKKTIKTVANVVTKTVNAVKTTVVKFTKKTSGESNKRPPTGEPGSTYVAPNGDRRTYGPDGKPVHDYDHSDHGNPKHHPHDENGGHHHDWVNGDRGDPYVPQLEPIIGIGVIGASTIGLVYVLGNDITGVGVADDFLVAPLSAGIGEGLILIF